MSSRPMPQGARGVHGAQAHKQGLITTTATVDRRAIAMRKDKEKSGNGSVVKRCTESEYDTLTGDLLMTKLRTVYRDTDDPHRVPVISTLAGLSTDAPFNQQGGPNVQHQAAAMMKECVFAGVSMSRIVDKTEMPGRIAPQTDVATQIGGVTTLPIYKDDAPFGRIVRAVPNPAPVHTQGHLGTNHRHLVVEVDGRDSSFGQRLQNACFAHFNRTSDPTGLDPVSTATAECLEKLTDFLMMGAIAYQVAQDLDDDGTRTLTARTDLFAANVARKNKQFRENFMRAMFAGLNSSNANNTIHDPKYLADPDNIKFDGGDATSKVHIMQVTASADFFTAMMDLMRMDNMWMIGKVIRGGKAPGECDVMLL